MSNATAIEHLKYSGYTLLPLTLFGHIALKFIEVFDDMKGTVNVLGIYKLNYNLISIIQLLLVAIGLFLTEYLIYKVVQNRIVKGKRIQLFAIQGAVPLIFAVLYLLLFFKAA